MLKNIKLNFIGFLAGLFVVALSAFLLFHFSLIWIFENVNICESNIAILVFETVVTVILLIFGFTAMVVMIKRGK